jgi:hypothetical protein
MPHSKLRFVLAWQQRPVTFTGYIGIRYQVYDQPIRAIESDARKGRALLTPS